MGIVSNLGTPMDRNGDLYAFAALAVWAGAMFYVFNFIWSLS